MDTVGDSEEQTNAQVSQQARPTRPDTAWRRPVTGTGPIAQVTVTTLEAQQAELLALLRALTTSGDEPYKVGLG